MDLAARELRLARRQASAASRGLVAVAGAGLCTPEGAQEVQAFFATKIGALPGGPRNLEGTKEANELCAAKVQAHRADAAAFFRSL